MKGEIFNYIFELFGKWNYCEGEYIRNNLFKYCFMFDWVIVIVYILINY